MNEEQRKLWEDARQYQKILSGIESQIQIMRTACHKASDTADSFDIRNARQAIENSSGTVGMLASGARELERKYGLPGEADKKVKSYNYFRDESTRDLNQIPGTR